MKFLRAFLAALFTVAATCAMAQSPKFPTFTLSGWNWPTTANSPFQITVSSAPAYAWPESTGANQFNGDFSRAAIPLTYTISGSCTLGCASTITIASTSPAGGVITAASTTAFTITGGSCPAPYSGSPYGASVFFNVYDTTNTTRLGRGYCSGGVFTFSGTASGSMSSSSDTVTLAQTYQWNPAVTPFQMQVNIGSSSGMNQETTNNGGRSGFAVFRPMINHAGQGDAAPYSVWCNVTNMRSGATTFLANPACELAGGNLSGNAPGAYLEGIGDLDFSDGGYDIAAIGNVYNFNRTNNTGALGTVWMGNFYTSYGSKAINAGWVAAGKFANVIDMVMATVSGAAVNLGYDQTIYFNSTATPINGTDWYGNVLGTSYMKYSSALGTLQIVSPTNVSVSGNLAVDNNLVAGFTAGTGAACTVASTCHNNAGRFTLGTSPASTIVISFNASNNWYASPVCFAQDETIHSPPVVLVSSGPGSGTYNFYAVQGTMLAGDIISYTCLGIAP